ncbi:MAG: hypothetical protein WBK46_04840, partial [Ruminococcus flavefaciens]
MKRRTRSAIAGALSLCFLAGVTVNNYTLKECVITAFAESSDANVSILQQPQSYSGPKGSNAVFTVEAEGEDVTYQWQWRFANKSTWYSISSNANDKTYSTTANDSTAQRVFRCLVSGKSVSEPVATNEVTIILDENTPVRIKEQPKNYIGYLGSDAVFTVE